jgi:tetratricopeptide (TPR) repeat protein
MPDTSSDRTLMALLELAADASSDERGTATRQTPTQLPSLPTLEQRTEMFLQAVYGPNCAVTAEMRSAARDRLLAAMAADLAETTSGAPAPRNPTVPASPSSAAQLAASVSDGFSQTCSSLGRSLRQLLSPAAEAFTMRGVRMAAVPLIALLIVGSVLTKSWIDYGNRPEAEKPGASLPAASRPTAAAPRTRSLAPSPNAQPAETAPERNLKREIAAAEAALGPTNPAVARKLVDLANLYRSEGRYAEAEALCTRALTIQQQTLGARDPDLLRTLRELATVYRAEGRTKEAEGILKRIDQP